MKSLIHIVLVALVFSSCATDIYGQNTKKREKEIKRFWKKELKIAKSHDHRRAAQNNPEIGWLSGLWCKENERKPYIHFELEGAKNIRVATQGYTASAHKVVYKPASFLYSEEQFLDKDVVVENESYYDLWYYPEGTGVTNTRYFYVERIMKVLDNRYLVVYRDNHTVKDPSIDFVDFYQRESRKISILKHWKTPHVYVACN